jgi:hypothetical protein
MNKKAIVVARVTLSHKNGKQTVIQIEADAGFHTFYRWYLRLPGRRDKTHLRNSDRNDAPDLISLAQRVKSQIERLAQIPIGLNRPAAERAGEVVTGYKVIVFKKKLYRRFLECSPTDLPGGLPASPRRASGLMEPDFNATRGLTNGQRLGHTTIARKWQILTGKA